MARVAYGAKGKISAAIQSGVIPPDTIIITDDAVETELLFYDIDGNLKSVAERSRFNALSEAEAWAKTYDCRGQIFSVHNGADWAMYQVQDDGTLSPVTGGAPQRIDRIDGGNAAGV